MIDLTDIVCAVFSVLAVVITTFFIPMIKSYVTDARMAQLHRFAHIAVNAAEQLFDVTAGATKLKYAEQAVTAMLEQHGLTVNYDVIRAEIENAVRILHKAV